ncbi:hypothetical protein F4782DRAFT_524054 [Xylaria castorea]|nr:hypothetical protein F4782DRAFT_524054 [Xylaria castorea]
MEVPSKAVWSTTDQTLQYKVYLGIWTNWSRGSVLGRTLTISRRDGDLLIAFTAFFIAFVGSRFWRIACLGIHNYYSTVEPRDVIHHQRQLILRNTESPDAGLLKLGQLLWAWRHSSSILRILPGLLIASFCVAAFTIAGGFSSQISSSAGTEVLLNGINCSLLQFRQNPSNFVPYDSWVSQLFSNALDYVQQCYSNDSSGLMGCKEFVTERIPVFINDTAPCPFPGPVCRTNTSNLILDTGYLDSHHHFGINAPSDERILHRRIVHCAPLITTGFSRDYQNQHGNYTLFDYGTSIASSDGLDFTYKAKSIETQYNIFKDDIVTGEYLLGNFRAFTLNETYISNNPFLPRLELSRTDADTLLLFLCGNGVLFAEYMDDDWYRATEPSGIVAPPGDDTTSMAYRPNVAASPMGCVFQHQFCIADESNCGALGGFYEAFAEALVLLGIDKSDVYDANFIPTAKATSSPIASRLTWLHSVFANVPDMLSIYSALGPRALASTQNLAGGLQAPLPATQWQADIIHSWATLLAISQALVVETAHGYVDPALEEMEVSPVNEAQKQICANQKIRSTEYTSLNFFALLFTYIFGLAIVVVSFALEPIMGLLQRRHNHKTYTHLEWVTNSTLQLHRLANEGRSLSPEPTWSRCMDTVPTTQIGVCLASLDISDVQHPKLARPGYLTHLSTNEESGRKQGSTPGEELSLVEETAPVEKPNTTTESAPLLQQVISSQSTPSMC